MRSLIAAAAGIAMLAGQVPLSSAFGQTATSPARISVHPSAVVEATFKAFPSGGDPLSMRIADLVSADPKLGAEFVIHMQNAPDLTRAQKLAAERGLAVAADRLGIKAQVGDNNPLAWVALLATLGTIGGGIAAGASGNNSNTPQAFAASRN